jgi:hypothetical protein
MTDEELERLDVLIEQAERDAAEGRSVTMTEEMLRKLEG